MMTDLGFSEAVYGFGAGIVHLGYALFKIPSNLFLERIGARKTFARITILWGITSIATMFVKTATSFYVLRFLLGSFEAGCPTASATTSSIRKFSKARVTPIPATGALIEGTATRPPPTGGTRWKLPRT